MKSQTEARLEALGLVLPEPFTAPSGRPYPFSWVRVQGSRVFVSGHLPQMPDGSLAEPLGKVGAEVSVDQAVGAARLVALATISSLKRAVGDLDRLVWLRVFGMVNVAPGFEDIPTVVNGFSELIRDVFGPERGNHARSAVGMAQLPFRVPVEIEAELELVD
ncbi:RidA family protein [Longimicrobium terrae]|uniref:Enamine deaminase RidA (YjgF/YER057c/UK114 family) n=1 Tax=Longimicrobium terrae TaxID=1639882 RepID=A0A841H324_9BACT|nr:RidA family protein [Longimicrobium terrae]MBB4638021.1 enamine deaminase RidA (YjgF/YER057c/UK114 family) [Longimicrobium terrae]MBB6072393.1 enamine deaminase RidA (YjgF/YER057c/UK114 family) [Longimicrobium terrae]NNC32193.1 RidA family protein [Longimicrobium terrae]